MYFHDNWQKRKKTNCKISYSHEHMQQKTKQVTSEAAKVGLRINAKKTKVIKVSTNKQKRNKSKQKREQTEQANSFNNLGSRIDEKGDRYRIRSQYMY